MLTDKRFNTESVTSGRITVTGHWAKVWAGGAVSWTTQTVFSRPRHIATSLYHCKVYTTTYSIIITAFVSCYQSPYATSYASSTMIQHAIGSARRPAPTTLFHVRGWNLATELSLWRGQSCGTVCQRQFVTRTVYTLLNADSNRTFLACVLMTDSIMPFRSFRAWRALNSLLLTTYSTETRPVSRLVFEIFSFKNYNVMMSWQKREEMDWWIFAGNASICYQYFWWTKLHIKQNYQRAAAAYG